MAFGSITKRDHLFPRRTTSSSAVDEATWHGICVDRRFLRDAVPFRFRIALRRNGSELSALKYRDRQSIKKPDRSQLGAPVETVRADFGREIASKRIYCETTWPVKGVPPEIVRRALSVLHPTGNPFLDLCIWKGRFPSRMAKFCTQYLKRLPLDRYLIDRMAEGFDVESWRGVRRDESHRRRNASTRERPAEGWTIVQSVAELSSTEVIESILRHGVKLTPLYSMAMRRVGCKPSWNIT